MADGTITRPVPTSPHPPLPNAPGWFARAAAQPGQTTALVGVIALAIVEAWSRISGDQMERDLQEKIAQMEADRAAEEERAEVSEAVKACAGLAEPGGAIDRFEQSQRAHANEQLEFQAEISQYTRGAVDAFAKKLKADVPAASDRHKEYEKKGFARATAERYR